MIERADKFAELNMFFKPLLDRFMVNKQEALDGRELAMLLAWLADRELSLGGLKQFYINATGEFAEQTVQAFKAIGANNKSSILEQANRLFPEGKPPREHEQRQQLLDSDCDQQQLKSLSEQYDACSEDVVELLYDYSR